MLIFGKSVGDWQEKAKYATDKADNDFAQIREIRCEGIDNVDTAFAAMAACAADTNCKKFLYHATINLNPGERLSLKQWMKAIDTLENNLNLSGHYRVVFEHIKKDRQHYHIIWSRIPPNGDRPAVTMGNNYYIHETTAKALEIEFGLKVAPQRDRSKPSRKQEEKNERNSRIRINPDIVTRDVTAIFKQSKTSKEFINNLAKAGYILTRGRNESLVLIDRQGGYHGLLRRIEGIRLGDLRQKFPDLDKIILPSMQEVLKARHPVARHGFRRAAAAMFKRPHYTSGKRVILYRPRKGSFATLLAQAKSSHKEKQRKYYPLPLMRRRRKKNLNEPKKRRPNREEIERSELLAYAWEHGRVDILMQFGIILPPDMFEP